MDAVVCKLSMGMEKLKFDKNVSVHLLSHGCSCLQAFNGFGETKT